MSLAVSPRASRRREIGEGLDCSNTHYVPRWLYTPDQNVRIPLIVELLLDVPDLQVRPAYEALDQQLAAASIGLVLEVRLLAFALPPP